MNTRRNKDTEFINRTISFNNIIEVKKKKLKKKKAVMIMEY